MLPRITKNVENSSIHLTNQPTIYKKLQKKTLAFAEYLGRGKLWVWVKCNSSFGGGKQ
jgi:hypothetical protein